MTLMANHDILTIPVGEVLAAAPLPPAEATLYAVGTSTLGLAEVAAPEVSEPETPRLAYTDLGFTAYFHHPKDVAYRAGLAVKGRSSAVK